MFLLVICLLCGRLPVILAGEQPAFLLGENEKLDIVPMEGKATTLELGRNPVTVLTGNTGRKIIICAGDQNKSGEVEQGASLRLIDQSLTNYEKVIQWETQLTAYTVNHEATTAWFALRDGILNKNKVEAKICRVDLETFAIQELVVDSTPTHLELSSDCKWLAVATLGEGESSASGLAVIDAVTMKQVASFEIPKNPGALCFSDDSQSLVAASYGYHKDLMIQSPYFVKQKQPTAAGALVVDLSTMQGKPMELGEVNKAFLLSKNATVYVLSTTETSGMVNAVGPHGLAWTKAYDFVPLYIQETPDFSRLLITGANRISVLEKATGQSIKELTGESEFGSWIFPEGTYTAYAYNPSVRKLNIMNLDNFELGKTVTAGSAGLAILRGLAFALQFAQFAARPQYINGVRMPMHYSHIYWIYPARGNIVFCPEQKKLVILNSFLAQYYIYDIEKGLVDPNKGFANNKSLYLQMSPNGKYAIMVGGEAWKLIDPATGETVLRFGPPSQIKVRFVFQQPTMYDLYISPDGDRMYIPAGGKVTVIDLQNGKKLKNISTKAKDAIVCW